MKRVSLFLLAIGLFGSTFAQNNAMNNEFSSYVNNDDYTQITITGKLFQMIADIDSDDPDAADLIEASKGIEGIQIIVADEISNAEAQYKSAVNKLDGNFESLMTVVDKECNVDFLIKDNGGIISEMFMVVGDNDGLVLVDIWGEIDLDKIMKITENIDIEGMEHFDKDAAEASRYVNFYPNPIKVGTNGNLIVNEKTLGATMKVYDMKGKVVTEKVINDYTNEVDLNDLAQGTYVFTLWKGKVRIFNEQIVITK